MNVYSPQPNLPVLLNRIKNVAKVFLATNSDYSYTEVSCSAMLISDDILIGCICAIYTFI